MDQGDDDKLLQELDKIIQGPTQQQGKHEEMEHMHQYVAQLQSLPPSNAGSSSQSSSRSSSPDDASSSHAAGPLTQTQAIASALDTSSGSSVLMHTCSQHVELSRMDTIRAEEMDDALQQQTHEEEGHDGAASEAEDDDDEEELFTLAAATTMALPDEGQTTGLTPPPPLEEQHEAAALSTEVVLAPVLPLLPSPPPPQAPSSAPAEIIAMPLPEMESVPSSSLPPLPPPPPPTSSPPQQQQAHPQTDEDVLNKTLNALDEPEEEPTEKVPLPQHTLRWKETGDDDEEGGGLPSSLMAIGMMPTSHAVTTELCLHAGDSEEEEEEEEELGGGKMQQRTRVFATGELTADDFMDDSNDGFLPARASSISFGAANASGASRHTETWAHRLPLPLSPPPPPSLQHQQSLPFLPPPPPPPPPASLPALPDASLSLPGLLPTVAPPRSLSMSVSSHRELDSLALDSDDDDDENELEARPPSLQPATTTTLRTTTTAPLSMSVASPRHHPAMPELDSLALDSDDDEEENELEARPPPPPLPTTTTATTAPLSSSLLLSFSSEHQQHTQQQHTHTPLTYQPPLTILARVRSFLPQHQQQQPLSSSSPSPHLRVINKHRLVLVNPDAFQDADPDVVVGLVAAINRVCVSSSSKAASCGSGGGKGSVEESNEWARAFELDRAFWSGDSKDAHYINQAAIYAELGSQLEQEAFVQGVDVTCFAFGASKSGKTYTLFGSEQALQDPTLSHPDLGLLPRLFTTALAKYISPSPSSSSSSQQQQQQQQQYQTRLSLSVLEISQQEGLRDLLQDPKLPQQGPLRIREHPAHGPFVENLTITELSTPAKLHQVLRRIAAATTNSKQNTHTHTQNHHVLVTAYIHRISPTTGAVLGQSRLQFVDLAGMKQEQQQQPGSSPSTSTSSPSPRRRYQSTMTFGAGGPNTNAMQQSLTALGTMLKQLGSSASAGGAGDEDSSSSSLLLGGGSSSPRTSPLTWLTQKGLVSPGAHSYLLLCLDPSAEAYHDSLHTLNFGEPLCSLRRRRHHHSRLLSSPSKGMGGRRQTQTRLVMESDATFSLQQPQQQGDPGTPVRDSDVHDWSLVVEDDFDGLMQRLSGGGGGGGSSRGTGTGGTCARSVLRETVSDPQQRLVKLKQAMAMEQAAQSQLPLGSDDGEEEEEEEEELEASASSQSTNFSHDVGKLRARSTQLELELQSMRVDRDVARSESRMAQDEMLRFKSHELKANSKKIHDLENALTGLRHEYQLLEDTAQEHENERIYLSQLLEETKTFHADDLRRLQAHVKKLQQEKEELTERAAGGAVGKQQQQQLALLQRQLATAEQQKKQLELELHEVADKLDQMGSDATESSRANASLKEEVSSLRAKLVAASGNNTNVESLLRQHQQQRLELMEQVRAKETVLLEHRRESHRVANLLYDRVLALERVALLDGLALRDGLCAETAALSMELRRWMERLDREAYGGGSLGSSSSFLHHQRPSYHNHAAAYPPSPPQAQAQAPPPVPQQIHVAAASGGPPVSFESRLSGINECLRQENIELKEKLRNLESRDATKSLVETLVSGIKGTSSPPCNNNHNNSNNNHSSSSGSSSRQRKPPTSSSSRRKNRSSSHHYMSTTASDDGGGSRSSEYGYDDDCDYEEDGGTFYDDGASASDCSSRRSHHYHHHGNHHSSSRRNNNNHSSSYSSYRPPPVPPPPPLHHSYPSASSSTYDHSCCGDETVGGVTAAEEEVQDRMQDLEDYRAILREELSAAAVGGTAANAHGSGAADHHHHSSSHHHHREPSRDVELELAEAREEALRLHQEKEALLGELEDLDELLMEAETEGIDLFAANNNNHNKNKSKQPASNRRASSKKPQASSSSAAAAAAAADLQELVAEEVLKAMAGGSGGGGGLTTKKKSSSTSTSTAAAPVNNNTKQYLQLLEKKRRQQQQQQQQRGGISSGRSTPLGSHFAAAAGPGGYMPMSSKDRGACPAPRERDVGKGKTEWVRESKIIEDWIGSLRSPTNAGGTGSRPPFGGASSK